MAVPAPKTPRKRKPRKARPTPQPVVATPDPEEAALYGGGPAPGTGFAGMRVVPTPDEGPTDPIPTPDPAPAPDPEPAPSPLVLRTPTVEDVDRLWDWVRADGVSRIPYLERVSNSQMLHGLVGSLIQGEDAGVSAFRSLVWHGTHVGFGYISPIWGDQGSAHAYLSPEARTVEARHILRAAVLAAKQTWPDLHLVVVAPDPRIQRLAKRLGFTQLLYVAMETL